METVVADVNTWLRGSPLLPSLILPHSGPECAATNGCVDPVRVVIFSVVAHILQFAFFAGICQLFERYRKIAYLDKIMVVASLVATVHGAIAFQGSLRAIFLETSDPNTWYTHRTEMIDFYAAYTHGYFVYDLIIIYLAYWTPLMILHHTIAAITFLTFFNGLGGVFYTCYFLIVEGSNPFLNTRFVLSKLGFEDSIWYHIDSALLFLTFLVCRIGSMAYFAYNIVMSNENSAHATNTFRWFFLFIVAIMYVLNLYWFGMMLGAVISIIKGDRDAIKKLEDELSIEQQQPAKKKAE